MSSIPTTRNVIEFIKGDVEERYKCIQCRHVLRDPVQSSCGHRFCFLCVEGIFQKDPSEHKCPDDGEALSRNEVFMDKCAKRELLSLECFCYNKSRGCQWTGQLANLQDHDSECPFSEIKCLYSDLGCSVVVLRYLLAKHIENDCLYKVVNCPYCELGFSGVKMREHLEVCGKFPVKCPHGCDQDEILREKLQDHSNSCPKVPVQCSFSGMGCKFRGSRESLEDHISSSAAEHLAISSKYIQEIVQKMENLQLKLNASQELNQSYEARLSLQNEALALNKQTLSTHQVKLARLEANLDIQRQISDELRKNVQGLLKANENRPGGENIHGVVQRLDFQEERMTLIAEEVTQLRESPPSRSSGRAGERVSLPSASGNNQRLDRLEHSFTLHEIQMADTDLKLQILEAATYDGTFLWKIDEFQRRFRESVEGKTISIYSPPFYTSRNGYKLCARAYLNGDGPTGKGKYVSLFIVLMRGEYDALLSWPFRQRITFKLLDQELISDVTETFRPDPNSSSFQRPRSEMNIASGCPHFCSHNLLRSRGYIRDDTIFIKVIVDTIGLPMI